MSAVVCPCGDGTCAPTHSGTGRWSLDGVRCAGCGFTSQYHRDIAGKLYCYNCIRDGRVRTQRSFKIRTSMVYFLMAELSFVPSAIGIWYHALVWLVPIGYAIAMASVALNYAAHREKEVIRHAAH